MKSEIRERSTEARTVTFPCIRGDSSLVVLFENYTTGTVLLSDMNDWSVGDHDNNWDIDIFLLLKGELVLSND